MREAKLSDHPRVKDLTGQTFSRLTVLEFAGVRDRNARWLCQCSCGDFVTVDAMKLKSGHTKSCGCHRQEVGVANGRATRTHGDGATKLYQVWRNMLTRCSDQDYISYSDYGGRGITIAEGFLKYEGFRDYIMDRLGRLPMAGESLDRIDNGGNYEPGNLRWATRKQQNRNRRNTLMVVVNNEELSLAEAVERYGATNYSAIYLRLTKYGWPLEEALNTPPMRQGERRFQPSTQPMK